MASTSDGRYTRFLRDALPWAFGAGVVAAAALGAMLLAGGQATAQPLTVPGIATFEVPDGISIPAGPFGAEHPQPQPLALPQAAEAPVFSAPVETILFAQPFGLPLSSQPTDAVLPPESVDPLPLAQIVDPPLLLETVAVPSPTRTAPLLVEFVDGLVLPQRVDAPLPVEPVDVPLPANAPLLAELFDGHLLSQLVRTSLFSQFAEALQRPRAIDPFSLTRTVEVPLPLGADMGVATKSDEVTILPESAEALQVLAPADASGRERLVPVAGVESALPAGFPGASAPGATPAMEFPFADVIRTEFPFLADVLGIRSPTPAPAPAVATEKSAGAVAVDAARDKVGADYGMGATGPDSFDCSGLVQWSYGQAGVEVPRTSYGQLSAGTPVSVDELEPGDMVSFYDGGHSTLYAGDGQVIHASTYGTGVTMSPMSEMPYAGARRF